jgi:hexosaminidase
VSAIYTIHLHNFLLVVKMLFSTFAALLLAPATVTAVWPLPKQFTNGSTPLQLAHNFQISLSGVNNAPQDLRAAVSRTYGFLKTDQLQALVIDRGASSANAIQSAKTLPSLTLYLTNANATQSIAAETTVDVESRVEGYTLTVPADGSGATLKANSTLGLFRGLTTFGQLWYDWQGMTYTPQAPFNIVDAPAYVRASQLLLYPCLTVYLALAWINVGYVQELVSLLCMTF